MRQTNPLRFKGFRNPTLTNCFMDSVFVAMFGPHICFLDGGVKNPDSNTVRLFLEGQTSVQSSFYKHFVANKVTRSYYDKHNDKSLCFSGDNDTDFEIFEHFQLAVRQIYQQLKDGVSPAVCTDFRDLFSACMTFTQMQRGQNDANEFYEKLLQLFGYSPMLTYSYTVFWNSISGKSCFDSSLTIKDLHHSSSLSLNMSRSNGIAKSQKYSFGKEVTPISLLHAIKDADFFHLEEKYKPRCYKQVQTETGVELVKLEDQEKFEVDYESVTNYIIKCDTLVISRNRQTTESGVIVRQKVTVPQTIKINTREKLPQTTTFEEFAKSRPDFKIKDLKSFQTLEYKLLAVVLGFQADISAGHYTNLLNVPVSETHKQTESESDTKRQRLATNTQWVFFDDLSKEPQFVSDQKAQTMFEADGVLFFYYPMGKAEIKK